MIALYREAAFAKAYRVQREIAELLSLDPADARLDQIMRDRNGSFDAAPTPRLMR